MPQVIAAGRITPDVGNIMVGKGNVIFQPVGDAGFFHLGNIPKFSITPKPEILKHFSSMAGTKTKDATFVISQEMECAMTLEEASYNNMRLLFSGAVNLTAPAAPIVSMLAFSSISGHMKYYASNDVGPRWYVDLPSVTFFPTGSFEAISDGFNQMQMTGTVNFVNGVWGTMTLEPQANTIAPSNIILPSIDLGGETVPTPGEAYKCYIGAWIGAVTYAFQWQESTTSGGTYTNIVGATAQMYTPVTGDLTKYLICQVTATNSIGSTVALTPFVGPVT